MAGSVSIQPNVNEARANPLGFCNSDRLSELKIASGLRRLAIIVLLSLAPSAFASSVRLPSRPSPKTDHTMLQGPSPLRTVTPPASVEIPVAISAAPSAVLQLEPTVPQLTYSSNELFTEIARINGADVPDYHATAFWYNGYLGIVFSAGMFDGGVTLYDMQNPRQPVLVGRGEDSGQREGHTTGFAETSAGMLAVSLASNGLNLWDLNTASDPHVAYNIPLPGIMPSDYDFGAWWVAVQSPWLYVAGSYNGLYIVDISDLSQPVLRKHLRMEGGFRCGSLFVVGNLLVQSTSEGLLTRLYDISVPDDPILLKEFEQQYTSYATQFVGGFLYAASERGGIELIDLHDVSAPYTVATTHIDGAGAYLMVQDDQVHLGNSHRYYKVSVSDPLAMVVLGSATITTELPEVDVDFASHLGNLVVLSDDHNLTALNAGSRIVPHTSSPDTTPPVANFIHPSEGAMDLPVTSRVGITFSDQILVSSVSPETFQVLGPAGPVSGKFSIQQNTVNFSPDPELSYETAYEVVIPTGGIHDLAGNAASQEFRSSFTTGRRPIHPPRADAGPDLTAWLGELTTFNGSGTRAGVGKLEYSWDPGDGSSPSAFSSNPTWSYTYERSGHFTAILTVRDSLSQFSSDSLRITAVLRPLTDLPTHSSTLIEDPSTGRIWVVNPDNDSVSVVNATTLELEAEISVGYRPTTLTRTVDGLIATVTSEADELVLIDGISLEILSRLPFERGARPHGVVSDPADPILYVSLEGIGQVLALDAFTLEQIWRSSVGLHPRGLAVVEESVCVSRFLSPETNGEVYELDRMTGAWIQTWSVAQDPGPDSDISSRGTPNYLGQLVASPDGGRLFLPSIKQNTARGLYRDGQAMTFETTNRAIVSVLDRRSNSEDLAARRDLDNRDHASAIHLTELGDYGFVALQGSQAVVILNLLNGQEVGAIPFVGAAPQGVWLDEQGRLFVQNFMSRTLSVYDVSTFTEPETVIRLASIRTVQTEALSQTELLGKRIFYNAADPRMSRDSYISCAGCHLDGDSDRRVWDFTDRGEGLRRTTMLRARGGMLHGPVHWSANFDEIQDFENDMRNAFGGRGFMSDSDFQTGTRSETLGDKKAGVSPELDALAVYVSSLVLADSSPYREEDGSLTPSAQNGRVLFNDPEVGCADCHLPPHFTDSTLANGSSDYILHDVGTLSAASGSRMGAELVGIDTPTLKGVWNNGPYLHDGSASSVREVLSERNVQDQHGRTSHLSEQELLELEAYVLSIDGSSGSPLVVSMDPEPGATRWSPASVQVVFSSVLDPASVTNGALAVKKGSSIVAGQWQITRHKATFRPETTMTGGTYTVEVNTGVASIDGDTAPFWTGQFTVSDPPLATNLHAYGSRSDAYELAANFKRGVRVYGDEDFIVLKVPSFLSGADYIRTANGDRGESRPALVSFYLAAKAKVYVAVDPRQGSLPGWMDGFIETGASVLLTDEKRPHPIYEAEFPPGWVYLGGAKADGGSDSERNYFVMIGHE